MEPHSTNDVHEIPDLNCGNENLEDEHVTPVSGVDNIEAVNEAAYVNLTVEEMERKLQPGALVDNELVANALYNKYARAKGFTVRKGTNVPFTDGSGGLQAKFFHCNREGTKDTKRSKSNIPGYQKTENRCGCLAKLKVARKKGEPWKIALFHSEHNHPLYAPDETYMLRSSREVTIEQEVVLTSMVNSRIPVSNAIKYLESVSGGRDRVGFLPHDAYNRLQSTKRKTKIENGDSFDLIQYFRDKANNEPDFYWDYDIDDDKRLLNFFFRDPRCLIDYGHFNEVVSFDTTYRTNIYHMVCAPFVGINHHGENVMFGCAFMSNETEKSFTWLFKTFLKSMGGKQPGMIFTDQCQAMINASEVVFPDSCKKLCQWHINQNAPSHFGALNNDSKFKYLWDKCMNFCDSEEEFEVTWKKMEDGYNINEVDWFNKMYALRRKWATAFSNSKFSAGLKITSRSEGTNSALKKEIKNSTCSLLDCVLAYERVQENWRVKEKEKDILCHHNKPTPLVPRNPLLMRATDVYTYNVYKLFEKELMDTMSLEIIERFTPEGSSSVLFKLKIYGESKHYKVVEFHSQNLEVRCSCHKYETDGILCSHALKVFDAVNMRTIPERYINKRWTKSAKSDSCGGTRGSDRSGNQASNIYVYEMAFVSHATKEIRELATQGKAHKETRDILNKHIDNARKKIKLWFENGNLNDGAQGEFIVEKGNNLDVDDNTVREPLVAKTRGVNNVQRRHWDAKKSKGKGAAKASEHAESSKENVGPKRGRKRKVQETQHVLDNPPTYSTPILNDLTNVQLPPFSLRYAAPNYVQPPQFPMAHSASNNVRHSQFYMGYNSSIPSQPTLGFLNTMNGVNPFGIHNPSLGNFNNDLWKLK